jgi:D-threo-aldose 1-dehydrogenase
MNHLARQRVGGTELHVPLLGFGGATLGDARGSVPEEQALATISGAYAAGIDLFDTSPWYGNGKSELRLGAVLREKPRESFLLTTKVGRVYARAADRSHPAQQRWAGGLPFNPRFDYMRDGVLRSHEQSLLRLGFARVDALAIHDLDEGHHGSPEAVDRALGQLVSGGGFEALAELKRAGEIKAIGAGINRTGMIPRFLERFPIDFFLLAMPYTLLNQEALDTELPLCLEHGASVILGAPFASGILASPTRPEATYGYGPASGEVVERVRAIELVCARYGVPLGAAALQFPLAHPAIVSVIPGPNHPDQVRTNVQWMARAIPDALWAELKRERLIRTDAPCPPRDRA